MSIVKCISQIRQTFFLIYAAHHILYKRIYNVIQGQSLAKDHAFSPIFSMFLLLFYLYAFNSFKKANIKHFCYKSKFLDIVMASVGDGNPTMSETRVVMKMNILPDVSMKDYQYLH